MTGLLESFNITKKRKNVEISPGRNCKGPSIVTVKKRKIEIDWSVFE
jgi:hypothetical protein